ncbi:MAG: hypothetical protein HOP30_13960 [Cyclobacteriaceae bacterium]|nr:hypothetical protein [Cyclobacteriaceae bacterium]
MDLLTRAQLIRLREKMLGLLVQVEQSTDLSVRRTLCASYYSQKIRELELLSEHLEVATEMLSTKSICHFYKEAYCQWRHDVRWLHRFFRKRPVL